MSFEPIPQQIINAGSVRGTANAYGVRRDGQWVMTSWQDYVGQVKAAARSLIALGVEPGEAVTILGSNTPEWVIFDVAAMAVGATPAGIYPTNAPEECG